MKLADKHAISYTMDFLQTLFADEKTQIAVETEDEGGDETGFHYAKNIPDYMIAEGFLGDKMKLVCMLVESEG